MPKIDVALSQVVGNAAVFRIPRVVVFNRLEPRPRTFDFSRSLRAEIRDAVWMLTRQWQFGEFRGEDAASPVVARIGYRHQPIATVRLGDGDPSAFDPETMPLETRVERESIPFVFRELTSGEVFSDALFAARWGKQLLRMLKDAGLDGHYDLYLRKFPIRVLPVDPAPGGAPRLVQDPDAEQIRIALRGRIADGVAVWHAVRSGTHDAWLDGEPGGDKPELKTVAAAFAAACTDRVKRVFTQPDAATDTAWRQSRLEYRFAVDPSSASGADGIELVADQYHGSRLDWYSFDSVRAARGSAEGEAAAPLPTDQVEYFLPAPVRFKGQPQPRFWQMEETETDFGKIETSTTGLLHLILAEFGLIYSNDWFMLPHPMDVNAVCEVYGILVDDTFGRHTLIRPAGRGPETMWQRFAMFHLAERQQRSQAGNRFYLVPAIGAALESAPIERVNFMRDEMANMVWAVEAIVPSQAGGRVSGSETARPPRPVPIGEATADVKIQYVAGTTVPSNWIPFIPVHAEGSVSEIRLQRARMAGGDQPRGLLLREPLSPYFVEEEEIPRTGIYVERSWQRTRWMDGRTLTWIGRRKTAGRGEAWAQLVFDQIVDLKQKTP
jgi:hypothetical protein